MSEKIMSKFLNNSVAAAPHEQSATMNMNITHEQATISKYSSRKQQTSHDTAQ
jgi:hypothetical protein